MTLKNDPYEPHEYMNLMKTNITDLLIAFSLVFLLYFSCILFYWAFFLLNSLLSNLIWCNDIIPLLYLYRMDQFIEFHFILGLSFLALTSYDNLEQLYKAIRFQTIFVAYHPNENSPHIHLITQEKM